MTWQKTFGGKFFSPQIPSLLELQAQITFFFMLLILKGLKKEVTSMKSPAYMTYLTMELSGLGPL